MINTNHKVFKSYRIKGTVQKNFEFINITITSEDIPQLTFYCPASVEVFDRIQELGFLKVGTRQRRMLVKNKGLIANYFAKKKYLKPVISTGYRSVLGAIDLFLKNYMNQEDINKDKDLIDQLSQIKQICEEKLKLKDQNRAHKIEQSHPIKNIELQNFADLSEDGLAKREYASSSPVKNVRDKRRNPGKVYKLKFEKSGRSITEVETFNAACYRLLLNIQHPEVLTVTDQGKRIGVASELISDFLPLHRYKKDDLTLKEMNDKKLGRIFVAMNLCEDEMDGHENNVGYSPSRKLFIKIDDAQATYRKSYRYSGERALKAGILATDADDIAKFPFIEKAKPRFHMNDEKYQEILKTPLNILKKSCDHQWRSRNKDEQKDIDEFNRQKYLLLLKRILIPDTVYINLANEILKTKNKPGIYSQEKIDKTKELTEALITLPEFHDFLTKQGEQAINEIKKEFEEYNHFQIYDEISKSYKKYSEVNLGIDVNTVCQNYNRLRERCNAKLLIIPALPPLEQKYRIEEWADDHPFSEKILMAGLIVVASSLLVVCLSAMSLLPPLLVIGATIAASVSFGFLSSGTLASTVGLLAITLGPFLGLSALGCGVTYRSQQSKKSMSSKKAHRYSNSAILPNVNAISPQSQQTAKTVTNPIVQKKKGLGWLGIFGCCLNISSVKSENKYGPVIVPKSFSKNS